MRWNCCCCCAACFQNFGRRIIKPCFSPLLSSARVLMTWSIISQVTVVCFHRGFGGWELNFIESKAVLALHWSKTSIFHKAGWTVAPPFTHLQSFERMHLVNADQIKRRVNDVPNSQAFLCWKLSTSEKDLSFYFFFFWNMYTSK